MAFRQANAKSQHTAVGVGRPSYLNGVRVRPATAQPAQATAILHEAVVVRENLYALFSAIAAGGTPTDSDLDAFNAVLQETLSHVHISAVEGHFSRQWPDDLHVPLCQVISSAEDLLRSEQVHRVRECGGTNCSWLFLDTSRNHSRRWCTMEGCGNRAKARTHYRRTKGES